MISKNSSIVFYSVFKGYEDSVDRIVQGNTSNIVFLKSTDDSMIDTLQKMSGTRHVVYRNSKTVTQDVEKLFMRTEGKLSYTMTAVEEPVIKYNDMAFIGERNSIIFSAGYSPIWNRNEMILPMSWRLYKDTIEHPGHSYTFQTTPTLSSAKEFDVRKNVPDFDKMVDKRVNQALEVDFAKEIYQNSYDYTIRDIDELDPDMYADDIMELVNRSLNGGLADNADIDAYEAEYLKMCSIAANAVENKEQMEATAEAMVRQKIMDKKCYAGNMLSKSSFKSVTGQYLSNLDGEIIAAYNEVRGDFEQDKINFCVKKGSLYAADGITPYIIKTQQDVTKEMLNKYGEDPDARVYMDQKLTREDINAMGSYMVTDDFKDFLISEDQWKFAGGRFEVEMARRLKIA